MNQPINSRKISIVTRAIHPLVLGLLAFFFGGCKQSAETPPSLPATPSPIDEMMTPAADHNTLPLEEFTKANGPIATGASALSEPRILVAGHHNTSRGDHNYIVTDLIIVNPLDEPMNYLGYRMDSFSSKTPSGQIHPLYVRQATDPDLGEVKIDSPFWCGTGSGMMGIPSKHAARFHAEIRMPAKSFRIGLTRLWNGSDGELKHETIWSDEITPQE